MTNQCESQLESWISLLYHLLVPVIFQNKTDIQINIKTLVCCCSKTYTDRPDIHIFVQVLSWWGVGASRSFACFCCSRSRSSGDGPGPNHSDCNNHCQSSQQNQRVKLFLLIRVRNKSNTVIRQYFKVSIAIYKNTVFIVFFFCF